MSALLVSKVVAALPGTLEKSTIYFVRVGTGFDLYVTNETGTVIAYALNNPTTNEVIDDRVAALLIAGDGFTVTYNDAGNALSLQPKVRLTGGLSGKPTNSFRQILGIAPRSGTFIAGSCAAGATAAATGSTVVTLKARNAAGTETTIGTMTWSAAATLAAISITAAFPAMSMIIADWPATADATLANIAMILSE